MQQFHSLRVSKSGGHASRVLQIGKHDRTRGRIKMGRASSIHRRRIRDSSQECLDHRGIDFDDLVGNAPMSFVMYFLKRILVGGVHQAKRLRSGLVMPICYETDAIFALDCQILYMRRDNVLASETFRVVAVHVNRLDSSLMIGNGVLADRKLA
jgi:hypothetical protein